LDCREEELRFGDTETVCDPEPISEDEEVCVIDGELLVEAHDESDCVTFPETVPENV
jgi:hypothetical protein